MAACKATDSEESSSTSSKMTLIEAAALHREKKLREQNEKSQQAKNRDLSLRNMDPFLKSYYKKVFNSRDMENEEDMEQRKEPRKLRVCLRYTPASINIPDSISIDSENTVDLSEKGHNLLDVCKQEDEATGQTELYSKLIITVVEGIFLHNGIPYSAQRSEKALVKVFLLPKGKTQAYECRTEYRYLTSSGDTRFNTRFLVKGFSKQDLDHLCLVIKVIGSTDRNKVMIGQAVISGEKALIKTDTEGGQRKPTEEEICPLREALESPGKSISTICELTAENLPCEQNRLASLESCLLRKTKSLPRLSLQGFPLNKPSPPSTPTKHKKVKKVTSVKQQFRAAFKLF